MPKQRKCNENGLGRAPDVVPADGQILYGVKAIAGFMGIRDRQALGLIERGRLPHFRIGKIVCAKRAAVLLWIDVQEAASAKPEAVCEGQVA